MFNNLWYPKQSPVQGVGGLWGGNFGNLVSGPTQTIDGDTVFVGVTRDRDGPSLQEVRDLMQGTDISWKNDTSRLNVSSGIAVFTIATTGTYRIRVGGARGGANYRSGDFYARQDAPGALMQADFALSSGNKMAMVLGSEGDPGFGNLNTGSNAGGGTFLWDSSSQSSPYTGGVGGSTLLLAAGGGGSTCPEGQLGGQTGQMQGQTSTSAATPYAPGGAVGTPGTNGTGGTEGGTGAYDGGGGAGWMGVGANNDISGQRWDGGQDTGQTNPMHGGWGGGGGAHDNQREVNVPGVGNVPWAHGRAGGGGYSGGCGGHYQHSGAGGGSYCKNSAVANSLTTSNGTFAITGSEHSTAYSGSVANLGEYNAGPGFISFTFIS